MQQVVELLGVINHRQVAMELAACRAYVQHSVVGSDGDSEGTPVVILEAGCCGIPVISTRHMGIVDVVTDGQTGILTDEKDVDAMAQALLKFADDPQLAGVMGQNARALVLKHYTLDSSIVKLKTVLYSK
jgi:glycosyltransferase involved in cell wall biosynthesis